MKPFSLLLAMAEVVFFVANASAQMTNALPGRSIIKLLPDYARPCVYALNQANGSVPGTLLALNSTNGAIINEISVNLNPTDMAMSPAGDAVYVINGGSRTISKVDLGTFSVTAEKAITTPSTYSLSNPLYLVAGPSGKIYYTDGAWGPEIYFFDFNAGTNLLVLDTGGNQSFGAGGLVMNRSGNTLYIWQQYGWSAGYANSDIASLAVGTNSLTITATGPSQSRDPLNTPIFLDAAERWIFNKVQKVSATNVTVLLTQFTDNIYAVSLDGSVAFGPNEVFNAQTSIVITNLPFSTTVQTLSGDQKKLFRYNSATTSLVVYDMASIASISGLAIVPTPADGSVVALAPTNLIWNPSPTALAYDVYFGTNQSAVGAATVSSPLYLGRVSTLGVSPGQQLVAGNTFYWRVDAVSFNATNAGPTWSFTVSKLAITPAQISVGGIAGYNPANTSLSLTSAAPTAWAAAVTGASWLTMNTTNGNTPATIAVAFNTAALVAGTYTNNIEFTVGTVKVEVPVTVTVAALNITKMAADLQRPYIYALQPPALSGQNGQLLFISTSSGNIDKALPVGINPVDLTIHYGENRLYVASWGENATYVVDLGNQTLLPPLHLGTDVYKINAGKPGRIVTEGEDQWIAVNIVDTSTGNVVGSMPYPEREGDGEMDPTGTFYYHCDNNISDAYIHKEQIVNDVVTEVAGSNQHPYGSRNLVLSPDGTTLFWQGYVYDANLNELGSLGEQVYATTAHGDLALGGQHVFNSHNGQTLYTWPFSSSIMAVSGDQQKVFLYNSTSSQIMIIPMSSIASVPGPGLNPTPANGAVINPPLPQVAWTISPAALSYQVYLGTNAAAVAAANTSSALYLGTTTSSFFSLSASVNPSVTYFWRVDSVGFSGVTTGAVWSFTVSALTVMPQTLSLSGVTGLPMLPQTISLTAPLATAWNLTIAQSWMSASISNGTTPSSVTLNFNTTNLTAGIYPNQLTLSANGITLQLPVTLQLFDLNASKMVADPNRNYIYVLHPGSGNFADAFLLFLNTDTGIVEKVIPIGINPTDMTVNRFEDRLYVSNWQHNQTRVVDLKTRTELTPLALGTDVYKINGGPLGRIVIEGEDQWVYASLINTASGSTITSIMVREGDGEYDPSGRYYYHVDNNDSGAAITKYDMTGDVYTSVASAGPHNYYGSRNLVMSLDGSRLFWTTAMYDANLTDFGAIGAEIYTCSTNGSIAFGSQQAFDTATKLVIYNLPVSSSVETVDRLNQRLWYFNSSTHRIENVPMFVIRQPSITQGPAANTSIIKGGAVYLTVTAMGLAPLSYQWTLSGTNVPAMTNYFLSINNIQPGQQGDYRAIVSNSFGSVTSTVATVIVLIPPSITSQSTGTNVMAGQSFSLFVNPGGTSPFTYRWVFENATIGGATNPTLTISNAQSVNEGIYQAVVANAVGAVTSAVISVRITPAAPTIVSNPASLTLPASSNGVFSVTAIGSPTLSYQWFFNTVPIAGATASQYSLSGIQSSNSGNYLVVVTNSLGSVTSAVAKLIVTPLAPYFTIQPVGASVSAGSSRTLTGLANGTQPISYQWQHSSTNLPGATQTSLTLNNLGLNDSGAYTLLASNVVNVSTSFVAQLTVYQTPAILQPLTNQVVDIGSTVVLAVNAVGSPTLAYSWQLNGVSIAGASPTLTVTNILPSQSGYYRVTVTNQFGSVSSTGRVSVLRLPSWVVAWGDNSGGQTNAPNNLADAVAVAGGDYHSLALHHNGTLIAWGYNGDGQTTVPTNSLRFVSIAAGAAHNLAITENGSLVAWGRNDYGQLNIPSAATNNVLAVAAGDSHSLALLGSGTVVAWGDNSLGQTSVPQGLSGVRAIAAGREDSLALRTNGIVVGWGFNAYGQTTPPAGLSNVVAIAAGYLHSAALCSNGTVVVWGDDTYGQTNVPPGLSNVVAIAAGDFDTLALRADGTVTGWGDDSYGQTNVPATVTNAFAIASGYYHGLALIPAIPSPQLQMTSAGLVIQWQGSGILQWAPTPAGPFTDVPCQGSCYTNIDMSAPAKFFRLRR